MPLHMNSLYPSVWLLTTGAHNLHAAFECHIQRLAETLGSIQTAPDFNFKARLKAALTHRTACLNPSPPVRLNQRSLKQIPAFEPDSIRTLWTRRILWFRSLILLLLSSCVNILLIFFLCQYSVIFNNSNWNNFSWKKFLLMLMTKCKMTKMCFKL